jgi:type IV pilus assembly protein PilA
MKFCLKDKKGFTLIELLVVIGILAILLSIVLIAINPARQFAQANDTKRRSDVTAILNAISQYGADHHGSLPTGLTLGMPTTPIASDDGTDPVEADICTDVMPTYISALPVDPQVNDGEAVTACTDLTAVPPVTYTTGYSVAVDAQGRVTVSATGEITPNITITR